MDRLAGTLLDLYANMQENFKVDDYRHYLFTPRDITAVVIGCLRYDLQTYHVLDVLTYEAERVFRDRLVGDDAMRLFDGSVWGNLLRSIWNHKLDLKDSYFTTWLTDSSASEIKMLGKANCADLTQYIQRELEIYARENSELDMLLFAEIVQRIARLDRILSEPGGSALMIGRPGVGRRTCSSIACFMKKNREGSPMQIFSPNIGRDYGSKHFMEDLKKAVQAAGVMGNHCALYLEDYQLADAAFLEIVNSLLSSGEVPGMFTSQELDALLHPLKEEFSNQGFKYKTLYSFFVSRVQKNLHIILSLDPTHPDFAMRCESNPALFSRCTILWLEAWSKEGMLQVPKMRLRETLKSVPNPEIMVQNIYMLHDSMAPYKVAPRQYCTLLESIGKLYEDKKSDLDKQRNFLRGGLTKLDETWATVDTLSREAMDQEKVLQDKQHQAKEKMKEITVNMEDAGRKKSEAEELSKKLKIDEAAMQERKAVVDDQLADCIPVLEAAKKAVSGIKKDNLNEIRSLKLPPEPIRDVLEGVLRLMNNQDTSWISMKRFLSQPSVITEIMDFDAKSITPEMREGVKNLLVSKRTSFDDATIARVSMAAAPMAAWVKAQIQYSLVLQTIKPLTDELDKLNKNLEVGTKRKEQCLHDIRQSDEIVAQLQDEHQKLTDEAADLRSELKKTKDTLTAAESLLGKLKDEKERWGNQMKDMDLQMERLPMTLLMASSFITYLGIMPEDTRLEMTSLWCRRLELPEFRFMLMMSSETERLEWKAQGLPGDDLSAENSIIITKSTLYPLIIDPSTQASKWLTSYLAAQKCSVELTTQQDAKFIQKLELSVRFGKTLVIQEVDR
jgi:dynein heavy chain 2